MHYTLPAKFTAVWETVGSLWFEHRFGTEGCMKVNGVTAESSAQHRFCTDFRCCLQLTFEKTFKKWHLCTTWEGSGAVIRHKQGYQPQHDVRPIPTVPNLQPTASALMNDTWQGDLPHVCLTLTYLTWNRQAEQSCTETLQGCGLGFLSSLGDVGTSLHSCCSSLT